MLRWDSCADFVKKRGGCSAASVVSSRMAQYWQSNLSPDFHDHLSNLVCGVQDMTTHQNVPTFELFWTVSDVVITYGLDAIKQSPSKFQKSRSTDGRPMTSCIGSDATWWAKCMRLAVCIHLSHSQNVWDF